MGNHTIAQRMYRHDPQLDRKLAALLGFLGTDVPDELLRS